MRSVLATVLLGLAACIAAGLTGLRLADGDLTRVFGAPASKIGDHLYDFDPNEVVEMQLAGNGVSAICRRGPDGWEVISPWKDRVDPRVIQALFSFTLGTRVEGAIPRNKVESLNLGFEDGQIGVRLADAEDDPLAKFMIGHRTAWVGTDPETGETFPTIFLQPRDKSRKDFLYACTDPWNIHTVLGDGFKRLRDHHPFLFQPQTIQSIRIRNRSGELRLSRERPDQTFGIVKPLELKSRREAVVELLQGLYDLEATEVLSRSAVTLPGTDPETLDQIALLRFGQEQETLLEIYPPESESASSVLATVSDRPGAVFRLPLTPRSADLAEKSVPSISDLPMSVNELRDPTLASITPRGLAGILISPAIGDDILVRRNGPEDRFSVMLDGRLHRPSETALFSLLQAVNEGQVLEFVSDSATDLGRYGLESPFLLLRFLGFDGSKLTLSFGHDPEGNLYAIRGGSTTVVRLDPAMLGLIPTRTRDWRPPLVWKISEVNVNSFVRRQKGSKELVLFTDFNAESWRARLGSEDVTDRLSKERARNLLANILDLKAVAWLPVGQSGADQALADPDLEITLTVQTFDAEGEPAGPELMTLSVAKVTRGPTTICYGRVSQEANPFLLDPEVVELLAVDLIGEP
ncbi:DUF4340 domain-containing protein [Haloferula sp. A504]|uniref:DUF4340 domain-containing protein n=1 Tax=Haloferula sp. A504 TaxID=3373601 RepID=UPI0031C2D4DD|nr:DUF4340 domain-containing protein [Verrucomicrobiaceae bacterium E54]